MKTPEAAAGRGPILTSRAERITPFMVMEILERAGELEKSGRSVVHLEVGEPDFPTPEVIVEAMRNALAKGVFGYTHSQGDPELREALAAHYKREYGVRVEPERFLVCPGTSIGLTLLFGAILSPGDKVLITNPHYACYPNFPRFFGGTPVYLDLHEEEGFLPDPDRVKRILKREGRVKALLLNSPANPTGAVIGADLLQALAALPVFVISDEIYHGLNYLEERDRSVLEFSDECAVVGGFSKAYAMTGWRVGYLLAPRSLAAPLRNIFQNFLISVNAAVQKAAVAALEKARPDVLKMRSVYAGRRRVLLDGLKNLGFGAAAEPAGAFYVMSNFKRLSLDSRSLSFRFLEEAGVGTAPGADFGSGAEGFLRFSYAASKEDILLGLERLGDFIKRSF
ncbi:MAG: pyridoxal phosphate-dependent aminotransferase [Deltaproteobacteria bacterium]|nr:pyridoxal phosphate-dependent aminotransferase [Deltaproteobacteria bacterium]